MLCTRKEFRLLCLCNYKNRCIEIFQRYDYIKRFGKNKFTSLVVRICQNILIRQYVYMFYYFTLQAHFQS
jgi:hypothetical protein